MKSKSLRFLLASALSCMLGMSGSAYAESNVSADPDVVLEIAKGFGSATLDKDKNGDPKVTGKIDGASYVIFFYGCNSGLMCKSLQFVGYWQKSPRTTLKLANQFNNEKRFGRAYIDKDGDLVLDMTVELEYGMGRRNLEEHFADWKLAVRHLAAMVK